MCKLSDESVNKRDFLKICNLITCKGLSKFDKISSLFLLLIKKTDIFSNLFALLRMYEPKPSLKIRTASAIFGIYHGLLIRDYGLRNIVLGMMLFCFSRKKAEGFSICLKQNLRNLAKFQLIRLIETIIDFIFSIRCLIELKLKILFQTNTESFSFLSWKTKKVYS